ncbi:MAG: hypothetical protein E7033_05660 [Akkermansiaceae bacterium]|nr:hypothetical protein [Akkermansiaceae bacterium]
MHTIGIDFGTTKTLVSRIKSRTGEAETVRLGHGSDHISTAIYITSTGEMVFGDDADDCLADPEGIYLRGFKMQLGSETPVTIFANEAGETTFYTAAELVTRYLSYIRERVQSTVFSGEPVSRAIITRPVDFSPARCEELRQAALAAGFKEVKLTTEPEAAALAYCRLNDTQAFRHSALVVDWGGGTLDFALVTRNNQRIDTHPRHSAGIVNLGGELFDQLLWDFATRQIQTSGVGKPNPFTSLPIVRKSKEKLSSATQCTLRLSSEGGICPPISLSRTDFNKLIAPHVEQAAVKILQLLNTISKDDAPEMLLLVGGSCRIPLIKSILESTCDLPAVSWHFSREAVALGAALWDSKIDSAPAPAHTPNTTTVVAGPDTKPQSPTSSPTQKRSKLKYLALAAGLCLLIGIILVLSFLDLRYAARNGYATYARLLLLCGADANKAAPDGCTPLHHAAQSGHTDCLDILIRHGADINAPNKTGQTPLLLAEQYKNTDCVTALIAAGADAERRAAEARAEEISKAAQTAQRMLHQLQSPLKELAAATAALKENDGNRQTLDTLQSKLNSCKELAQQAKKLLDDMNDKAILTAEGGELYTYYQSFTQSITTAEQLYAEVSPRIAERERKVAEARKRIDSTPADKREKLLISSAKENDADVLELLIQDGVNVNAQDEDCETPLIWAAYLGHYKCVELLLAAPGIDVNAQNKGGNTALHGASAVGQNKCIKLLLQSPGVDINLQNKNGYTPLIAAASVGHSECVKLLLESPGIDINLQEKNGCTPLIVAAAAGHSECVKLLLNAPGIDANLHDINEQTPLIAAAATGHSECVKLLLNAPGIDVNQQEKNGCTPLIVAAAAGHSECIKLLLNAPGIDVNQQEKNGCTPLIVAAGAGQRECVKLLLESPAIDVNLQEKNGCSPLIIAISTKQSDCVKILLESPNIDVNLPEKNGCPPLTIAAGAGLTECVKLLVADKRTQINKKFPQNKNGFTALKVAELQNHSECAKILKAAGGKK